MATTTSTAPVQRFDGFEVDPRARELRRKGIRVRIQDQPLEVLLLLLERIGDVVTREELKQRLWPEGTYVDAEDGLNTAVRKLREHLGDSADRPIYIETIPRRGYRFIGNIEKQANSVDAVQEFPAAPVQSAPEVPKHQKLQRSIAIATGLIAVVFFSWIVFRYRHPAAHPQVAIFSIAVLPLANLSGDQAQDYLADGITEELIGRLSMIRGFRIISRTSSMQFKDSRMTAPEIARALNVDALVEGSVLRVGDRVRVHAQLIRAATDEHFWSETYDRQMPDVLALESDVAQAIAQKVEVTVTGAEHARLVAARLVAPEVYESYLKGRRLVGGNTRAEFEGSIPFFEEAIRKDATFAPAYLGLADAYSHLGTDFIGGELATETRPKVINAARKALDLDMESSDAHVRLAQVYRELWQWSESESEVKRALELQPNNAAAHIEYSEWLLCQGRIDEGLAWARRARELDPLGRSGGIITAWALFQSRHYDDAIRELRSILAVQPDLADANWILGFVLISNGQPQQAIPALERAVSLTDRGPGTVGLLATAYARAGRRAEALRLVHELNHRRETGFVPAAAFVFPLVALASREQALASLERAYQEKSNLLQVIKVHPLLDPIRDDPRFAELVQRVGLN